MVHTEAELRGDLTGWECWFGNSSFKGSGEIRRRGEGLKDRGAFSGKALSLLEIQVGR